MALFDIDKQAKDNKTLGQQMALDTHLPYEYMAPYSYVYDDLKHDNNTYLRDDFWVEATRRGEIDTLVNALKRQPDANPTYNDIERYGERVDYDSYLLSLLVPLVDDKEKKAYTDSNGEALGEFTQKEWFLNILEMTKEHWDAEILDDEKRTRNFFENAGGWFVGVLGDIASGIVEGVHDIYNLGEGVVNFFKGEDFLAAFDNDSEEEFGRFTNLLKAEVYEWKRTMSFKDDVGAVKSLVNGYVYDGADSVGVGVGYGSLGKYTNAISQSIGYMLPSVLISLATGGMGSAFGAGGKALSLGSKALSLGSKALSAVSKARNLIFYTQMFSGFINETVDTAAMNGISYKDLNAGEVISNAALKSLAQFAVEKALIKVMGSSILDVFTGAARKTSISLLAKNAAKNATKLAQTSGAKAVGKATAHFAKDVLKEGLEESLQDLASGIVDLAYGGAGAGYSVSGKNNFTESGKQQVSIENLVDSFIAGAVTSAITASFSFTKFALNKNNRLIQVSTEGDVTRAKLFQSWNYHRAMDTVKSWRDTLHDKKASYADKLDAGAKISLFYESTANMYSEFGKDRAKAVNDMLLRLGADDKYENPAAYDALDLSKKLADDVFKNQKTLKEKYRAKIEAAAKAKGKKLRKAGVRQATTVKVIASEIPRTEGDEENEFVKVMRRLGVEVIVGVDANVITEQDGVIFASSGIVDAEDAKTLITGITYERVVSQIMSRMQKKTLNLVLEHYRRLTGRADAGYEDALAALLFDKNFYRHCLLSMKSSLSDNMLDVLTNLDSLVNNKDTKNALIRDTTETLVEKVRKNMEAGLVAYATLDAFVDVDSIKGLRTEVKEAIKTHRNVIFTSECREAMSRDATVHEKTAKRFDDYLDKLNANGTLDAQAVNALKQKARSNNFHTRVDAYLCLIALSYKNAFKTRGGGGNLVFLPTDPTNVYAKRTLDDCCTFFFGTQTNKTYDDLVSGNFSESDLTENGKEFLGTFPQNSIGRLTAITQYVYDTSNQKFTVGMNGQLQTVAVYDECVKPEYQGEEGRLRLRSDLRSHKIKTIKDITDKVPPSVGEKRVVMQKIEQGADGISNSLGIAVEERLSPSKIADVLMHELTHLVDHVTYGEYGISYGGSATTFDSLTNEVAEAIRAHVEEKYETFYKLFFSDGFERGSIFYGILLGEIKARSNTDFFFPLVGIMMSPDSQEFIMPDGTKFRKEIDTKKAKTALNIDKSLKKAALIISAKREKEQIIKKSEGGAYEGVIWYIDAGRPGKYKSLLRAEREGEIHDKIATTNLKRAEVLRVPVNAFGEYAVLDKRFHDRDKVIEHVLEHYPNKKAIDIVATNDEAKEFIVLDDSRIFTAPNGGEMSQLGESRPYDASGDTSDDTSGDTSGSEYISNKVAAKSNLKYFIKKGRPIRLHPDIAEFVVATTDDFEKLPKILRDKITEGSLSKLDMIRYIYKATTMNDYTFKAIASYVYHNEALASLSYAEFMAICNDIDILSVTAYFNRKNAVMDEVTSPANMREMHAQILSEPKYNKALDLAETVFINGNPVMAHADVADLKGLMFRHYDGTLRSVMSINNIAKFLDAMRKDAIAHNDKSAQWTRHPGDRDNTYTDMASYLSDTDTMSRDEKTDVIYNSTLDSIREKITKDGDGTKYTLRKVEAWLLNFKKSLENASDETLDELYAKTIEREQNPKSTEDIKVIMNDAPPSRKNLKDALRNNMRIIIRRVAGMKTLYKKLPEKLRDIYSFGATRIDSARYRDKTDEELIELIKLSKEAKIDLAIFRRTAIANNRTNERLDKKGVPTGQKKTVEKTQIIHTVTISNQTFNITSETEAPTTVRKLLNTAWDEKKQSAVKTLEGTSDYQVATAKAFYTENAQTLLSMDANEARQVIDFFDSAVMNNVSDANYAKFMSIKLLTLGFLYMHADALGLDADQKTHISKILQNMTTANAQGLALWKDISSRINIYDSMKSSEMRVGEYEVSDEEKDEYFDALKKRDVKGALDAQSKILANASAKRSKSSITTRILALRSMMMLSSPITWVRNIVSNVVLKGLHRVTDAIGNVLVRKKVQGQMTFKAEVTSGIKDFIQREFLNSGLYKTLTAHVGKFDIAKLAERTKGTTDITQLSGDDLLVHFMLKSMYGQFYAEEVFKKGGVTSKVQKLLMKALSDDAFVKKAALRYFGKILAEQGTDIHSGINDEVMRSFGMAIGMALQDYMHSDNAIGTFEKWLKKEHAAAYYAWKIMFPFAAASWNWAKAALRLSPIGLAQSIVKYAKLEIDLRKGKAPDSATTLYDIKRRVGAGVVGTIGWGIGMMLAGLGIIDVDDDDYGVPHLRVGNLKIDISSVFGSSSLLAGAVFISAGNKSKSFIEKLGAAAGILADSFFTMDLFNQIRYSRGNIADVAIRQVERVVMSFFPRILSWAAGATYTGTLKKTNVFERAIANIPFVGGAVLNKNVDPYTGEPEDGLWDVVHRMIGYLSYSDVSTQEAEANRLGLKTSQLLGKYDDFTIKGDDLAKVNELYGRMNADQITQFMRDQKAYRVKNDNGKFVTLRYSQMTDAMRKRVFSSIYSGNAAIAEIHGAILSGYTYTVDVDTYKRLRAYGVSGDYRVGRSNFKS